MTTFKDAITEVLYRIDEDVVDTDEEILEIVKNGINEGYTYLASTVDQRTKDITFPYSKGYQLPTDFVQEVNLEHEILGDLDELDYIIKSNLLYIKSKDAQNGNLTMKYAYSPDALVNDTDEIKLKVIWMQALTVYASYVYYTYRKKTDVAGLFFQEFKLLTGLTSTGGASSEA